MVFGVLPFVMNFYFAFSTTLFLVANTFINSFCKKAGCSAGSSSTAGRAGGQALGCECTQHGLCVLSHRSPSRYTAGLARQAAVVCWRELPPAVVHVRQGEGPCAARNLPPALPRLHVSFDLQLALVGPSY